MTSSPRAASGGFDPVLGRVLRTERTHRMGGSGMGRYPRGHRAVFMVGVLTATDWSRRRWLPPTVERRDAIWCDGRRAISGEAGRWAGNPNVAVVRHTGATPTSTTRPAPVRLRATLKLSAHRRWSGRSTSPARAPARTRRPATRSSRAPTSTTAPPKSQVAVARLRQQPQRRGGHGADRRLTTRLRRHRPACVTNWLTSPSVEELLQRRRRSERFTTSAVTAANEVTGQQHRHRDAAGLGYARRLG